MDIKRLRSICMEVLGGYKHRDIAARYGISPSLVSYFKDHLKKGGYLAGIVWRQHDQIIITNLLKPDFY